MGFHGTGPAVQTPPSWGIPSTARQRRALSLPPPSLLVPPPPSLHRASANLGRRVLAQKSQVERRRHGGLRGFVSALVQRCRRIGNIPLSRETRPRKRNERSIAASTSDGRGLRSYDSSSRRVMVIDWPLCLPAAEPERQPCCHGHVAITRSPSCRRAVLQKQSTLPDGHFAACRGKTCG